MTLGELNASIELAGIQHGTRDRDLLRQWCITNAMDLLTMGLIRLIPLRQDILVIEYGRLAVSVGLPGDSLLFAKRDRFSEAALVLAEEAGRG